MSIYKCYVCGRRVAGDGWDGNPCMNHGTGGLVCIGTMCAMARGTGMDAGLTIGGPPTQREPKPGERWRHWKGDLVIVTRIALDSETKAKLVVYIHETPDGRDWVRPLKMWHARDDPRFEGKARFEFEAESGEELERRCLGRAAILMHQPICSVCHAAIYTGFGNRGCAECLGIPPRTWWQWLRGREHPEVQRTRIRIQAQLDMPRACRNPRGNDTTIIICDEVDKLPTDIIARVLKPKEPPCPPKPTSSIS